ncbi:MAG: DoxX family protein [Bacteroidales bacterium]|nr:DoxX family protein [Bacteroidales bacterium]
MKNYNTGLLILRLSIGILMLFHGVDKILNGIEGIENMLETKGIPTFLAFGVYIGEVIAPVLLVIGFRARIAALLLTINMLVIIFIAHPSQILSLNQFGAWALELSGLYLFGALAIIFTGSGRYALSHKNMWD